MKLSMMSYTWSRQPQHFDLLKMLKQTQELGMAGIDLVGLHDRKAKELRQMVDDHGVPVVCHTFFADLNFPDASGRQAGCDAAKRSIEDAVILGAPVVMIPTPGKAGVDRHVGRRNWIAGLQALQPFAAQAGVVLTVENFPGADSPFVVADDVLEAVRTVPGVKVTYDNGNAASGEEPAESFRRCAVHVAHAHFKDWDIRDTPAEGYRLQLDGRYGKPALIGEGALNQKACLAAMRAAGYAGCINIEYEGNDYTPAEACRRAAAYLRGLGEGVE